jgi:hypothetical protein
LVLVAVLTSACKAGSDRDACPEAVDAALAEVDVVVPDRMDCGRVASFQESEVAAAWECFEDAVADGAAVELTVNRCIDCSIPYTFIATEGGKLYEVVLERDLFGDDLRVTSVASCTSIVFDVDDRAGPECTGSRELFTCEAPLD